MMRPIEFRVFFGEPNGKKELITAEEAFCENYIHFVGNELRPTDNCTVIQQFTGMTGKNGVKIFEGDIVRSVETNEIFSVHYSDLRGGFKRRADEDYVMTWGKELTVIGNAYEGVKK